MKTLSQLSDVLQQQPVDLQQTILQLRKKMIKQAVEQEWERYNTRLHNEYCSADYPSDMWNEADAGYPDLKVQPDLQNLIDQLVNFLCKNNPYVYKRASKALCELLDVLQQQEQSMLTNQLRQLLNDEKEHVRIHVTYALNELTNMLKQQLPNLQQEMISHAASSVENDSFNRWPSLDWLREEIDRLVAKLNYSGFSVNVYADEVANTLTQLFSTKNILIQLRNWCGKNNPITIRVPLIGPTLGGKSALAPRLAKDIYIAAPLATIGMEIFEKEVFMNNNEYVINFYDFPGISKPWETSVRIYAPFQKLNLVLLVVSTIENLDSQIDSLEKMLKDARLLPIYYDVEEIQVPLLLIGTMIDEVHKRKFTQDEAKIAQIKLGAVDYIECSAKTGENIEEVLKYVAKWTIADVSTLSSAQLMSTQGMFASSVATSSGANEHSEISVVEMPSLKLPTLISTVRSGNLMMVKKLLSEKDNRGMTAVHWAAREGHLLLLQWLLEESGTKIDNKDYRGWTALHWAAFYGHVAIVQWLLKKGASARLLRYDLEFYLKRTNEKILSSRQARSKADYCHLFVVGDLLRVDQSYSQKTALLYIYTQQKNLAEFDYIPTAFDKYIGSTKVDNESIKFSLWDSAGFEDYPSLGTSLFPQKNIILLIFSIIQPKTFENVARKWFPTVERCADANVMLVLVGMDGDKKNSPEVIAELAKNGQVPISSDMANKLVDELDLAAYLECTLSDLTSVNHLFTRCFSIFLKKESNKKPIRAEEVTLDLTIHKLLKQAEKAETAAQLISSQGILAAPPIFAATSSSSSEAKTVEHSLKH